MKLWELPVRWHCPLIGTCLTPRDMRRLARQAGVDSADMSEYELHTVVVGNCAERNALSERAQRLLDERFAADILRFAKAHDDEAILALWRAAYDAGETAGALWAAWSHGATSEDAGARICGDIHMLSHQIGAGIRANLRQIDALRQENARLRGELAALRNDAAQSRREKDRLLEATRRKLSSAESRAALLGVRELELADARQAARAYSTVYDRAQMLAHRVEVVEERNAANARRAERLAQELNEMRDNLAAAEAALELALGMEEGGCAGVAGNGGCGRACPAEVRLTNRCVLCIGGRANLVDGYRRLVEAQGGRFLHHDGGLEESLHRIDTAVAAADAVICQSGCVSHAAYWRLKEACKKLDKPCVFVKSPGVGSFARGLAALADDDGSGSPHQTASAARLAN
ncbi:MAG: DUF2325 domain-containing protein [Sterolibacterium sp.]|nr:DUF2325 domain-containing protein [Sterolibacterium sp.]